jgi:glycerol uptake facilitator-like aquaporin
VKIANIKVNKLVAEFIGTFVLSFVVLASTGGIFGDFISTPALAGGVLVLLVMSIGAVSGTHINPAVTAGLLSVKKIELNEAIGYVIAQMIGAAAAIFVLNGFVDGNVTRVGTEISSSLDMRIMLAELFGTAFFLFGIAAAIHNKLKDFTAAALIGGSLFLGIIMAAAGGSLGILNPAIALTLNAFNWTYVIGPILGAILGANVYTMLLTEKGKL